MRVCPSMFPTWDAAIKTEATSPTKAAGWGVQPSLHSALLISIIFHTLGCVLIGYGLVLEVHDVAASARWF